MKRSNKSLENTWKRAEEFIYNSGNPSPWYLDIKLTADGWKVIFIHKDLNNPRLIVFYESLDENIAEAIETALIKAKRGL